MEVAYDTVTLEIKHRMIVAQSWSPQCCTSCLALLLARFIPRRRADRETLSATHHTVEGIQLWPVDHRVLVTEEHLPAVIERVDHNSARVAELNLKDGVPILTPPLLADTRMVIPELEEMTEYGYRTRDFR